MENTLMFRPVLIFVCVGLAGLNVNERELHKRKAPQKGIKYETWPQFLGLPPVSLGVCVCVLGQLESDCRPRSSSSRRRRRWRRRRRVSEERPLAGTVQ